MSPNQGVVKQDWVATGRIDFATRLNGDHSLIFAFRRLPPADDWF